VPEESTLPTVDQVERVVGEAEDDGRGAGGPGDLVGLLAGEALMVIGGQPAVEDQAVGDRRDYLPRALFLREGGGGHGAAQGGGKEKSGSRHLRHLSGWMMGDNSRRDALKPFSAFDGGVRLLAGRPASRDRKRRKRDSPPPDSVPDHIEARG